MGGGGHDTVVMMTDETVLKSAPGASRRAQFVFMNVLTQLRERADFKRVAAVRSVCVGVV